MIERYRKIQRERAAGERDASGFTLIELLIVIVVMGILAAVVIFALGGVSGSSAIAACNTDAKSVETAVAAFEANGNSSTLLNSTSGPGLLTGSTDGGPYLQTWPSNSSYYSIGIDTATGGVTGEVDVTPKGGTAVNYNTESGSSLASGGCGAA